MLFYLDKIKGYTLCMKCFLILFMAKCKEWPFLKRENIKDLNSIVIDNRIFIFSKQSMYSDCLV